MYAEFTDDLITGYEIIDSQHRELISRINQLLICCENHCAKDEAVRLLDFLVEYTDFHFKAEEALQREVGYPGYEKHCEEHKKLVRVVGDLLTVLDEGDAMYEVFVRMLKTEVLDWLNYHIKGFDRSIAEFIFLAENVERL